MTWTYSSNPSTSAKDKIRFLVGDTDPNEPLITDEEIEWILSLQPDIYVAASMTALAISAKFARLADKEVGELRVSLSQKAEQYKELSQMLLKMRRTTSYPDIYAGGIEIESEDEEDPNLNRPYFRRGLFEK